MAEGEHPTLDLGGAPPPTATALKAGERLGRFSVVGPLGEGGMGVVYLAQDVELGRLVAIKILRPDAQGAGSAGRARLLREAQAMARLNHPNVVAIYEVGAHGDAVFIAMERIEGATLRQWLKGRQRTWREVAGVFQQAGRGLAAAHQAGLIHRDFKPDNVLIGKDGRVMVTDFGLARAVGEAAEPVAPATPPSPSPSPDVQDVLHSPLTQAGALVGTLAYMAPEQLSGGTLDARTDQFAFCIALFEALHGVRPFKPRVGHPFERNPAPGNALVPAWLTRTVERGLAVRPEDRFASMGDLLTALAADPSVRRRKLATMAGVGVALVAMAAGGALAVVRLQPSPCRAPERELEAVWNPKVRGQLGAGFSSAQEAVRQWPFVEKALDRAAERWLAAYADVCGSRESKRESEAAIQLRLDCLGRQRDAFGVVVETLGSSDPLLFHSPVAVVGTLPSPMECSDARALPLMEHLPPEKAKQVRALRSRLARIKARSQLTREGVMDELHAVQKEARALGNGAVEAEAYFFEAGHLSSIGDTKASLAAYRRAVEIADVEHLDVLAARAAATLVGNTAFAGGTKEEVDAQIEPARRRVERAGNSPLARQALEHALGSVMEIRGRSAEALPHMQQALDLQREISGADSLGVLLELNNLGSVYQDLGRDDESVTTLREAVALSDRLVGPGRDNLRIVWINLAWALGDLGRGSEAREAAEHAVKEPPDAYSDIALAIIAHGLVMDGRSQEGLVTAERALTLMESLKVENQQEGREVLRRCAIAYLHAGRVSEAVGLVDRLLTSAKPQLEENSPNWVPFLSVAGEAHASAGRTQRAKELLERAMVLQEGNRFYPGCVAEIRFRLAQVLAAERGDKARANQLAAAAAAELSKLPARKPLYDELVAWREAQR